MALIDCFECQKKVSTNAVSCPHCGNTDLRTKEQVEKEFQAKEFEKEQDWNEIWENAQKRGEEEDKWEKSGLVRPSSYVISISLGILVGLKIYSLVMSKISPNNSDSVIAIILAIGAGLFSSMLSFGIIKKLYLRLA